MKNLTILLTLLLSSVFMSASITPLKVNLPGGSLLHIYKAPSNNSGVTVIMCPGGGYHHLALTHEGHDMAEWFVNQGINYVVLEYRLPKTSCDTLPMIDAHEALSYLDRNAKRYGINNKKIGIMGASAGGHLASQIANTDSLVAFQILLYPVISMNDSIGHGGSRVNLLGRNVTAEIKDRFSNEKLVGEWTPQAFIALSSDDKDVNPLNSITYYIELLNHDIPVEVHIYPDGGHGWGFKDSFKHKQEWLQNLSSWLKDYVINK